MVVHQLYKSRPQTVDAGRRPGSDRPPRPSRIRLRLVQALAALAVLAAGAGGLWAVTRPTPVHIAPVVRGEAVDAVYASGVVEYVRQARIAPVVTAPIREVAAVEGERVRRGQTLAQLDDGPQLGTTLQLEAQAGLARAAAARQARLYEAGFGARAAYEDAQQQRDVAEAAARSARARLADYRLVAPFAGRVLRRDAEPGDLAAAGRPLFVVADTAALRVTADVDERDVGRLAVGLAAVVRADAFPGRAFPARVVEITPQGDAAGRVFRTRLSLPPDTALKPGMTVESNLVTARRPNAVLVPTAALREGAVWVVRAGRLQRRLVRTGVQGVERSEVLAGLSPGEQVVLNPTEKLRNRQRAVVASGGG